MASPNDARMPSDCRPIDAVDPASGKIHRVFLRNKKIQETARRGMGATKELAFSVPYVLRSPTAIFRGVREEGELEWLCYCGVPDAAYDYKTGNGGSAWENEVLLVFVTDEGIVYNWRWEPVDQCDEKMPERWETRFTERAL